jgi:heat shock protein HtpX
MIGAKALFKRPTMGHQDFRRLILANKRKTAVLMIGFCCLVPVISALLIPLLVTFIAGVWLRSILAAHPELSPAVLVLFIAGIAWVGSIVYCALMYNNGDQVVLRSVRAQRIRHDDDPELFNCIEEMAIAAGIPVPRIFRIDDPAANAMATGRDPDHASIVVTRGLREILSRDELQGVIAHEMSHVRNYDTRLMLMTAVLVGAIEGLCDYCVDWFQNLIVNLDPEQGYGQFSIMFLFAVILSVVITVWWLGPWTVLGIALAIACILALAPVSAHVIQFAVSRQREYLADASAVELARNPQGLASALFKIEHDRHRLRAVNGATAHLFIANPLPRFSRLGHTMFASHPPLKERIRRLASMSP